MSSQYFTAHTVLLLRFFVINRKVYDVTHSKGPNETKSISMPKTLWALVEVRKGEIGLSAYVRQLIKEDLARHAGTVLTVGPPINLPLGTHGKANCPDRSWKRRSGGPVNKTNNAEKEHE
jgi:hypothetical protein